MILLHRYGISLTEQRGRSPIFQQLLVIRYLRKLMTNRILRLLMAFAGWTADGNNVLIYDAYDWWKIDLTGERQPECFTKGYGRKNKRTIRKMTSNIDKEVFKPDETVVVSVWDENTMDEGIYSLDMKGRLKKLAEGPYIYAIHRFSDNQKYCIWNRQNMSEFRDLWWSKADFSDPVRITNANPSAK